MKDEYRQTWFRCEQEGWLTSFAIITAYNPHGVPRANPVTNELQNRNLETRLKALGLPYFPLLAGSKDFSHSEPSFAVAMPLNEAATLALEFNQDAIFWIENGIIQLVECESLKSETIAAWADRQASS